MKAQMCHMQKYPHFWFLVWVKLSARSVSDMSPCDSVWCFVERWLPRLVFRAVTSLIDFIFYNQLNLLFGISLHCFYHSQTFIKMSMYWCSISSCAQLRRACPTLVTVFGWLKASILKEAVLRPSGGPPHAELARFPVS